MQRDKDEILLLIDVGNTNTKLGITINGTIQQSFVLPTLTSETLDTFGMKVVDLFNFLQISNFAVDAWVVSSVVPQVDHLIRYAGKRYSDCPVYFLPMDIPLAINNKYETPGEVGADRLVTAFAARELLDSSGLIVIDFGTATTLECVQDRDYLGGLICPGVLSSLGALGGGTAKLPRIGLELESRELQIGVNTAKSMKHGFIFGFASMVDGLCNELKKKLQGDVQIVGTGGFAHKIRPVCKSLHTVYTDLLLKGLYLGYRGQSTEDRGQSTDDRRQKKEDRG